MRARVPALLATVAAILAVFAPPATAATPLTVTPGGPADGFASPFEFVIGDPVSGSVGIVCDSATIHLNFDNEFSAITGSEYEGCLVAEFVPIEITQVGIWPLNAVAYDPGTGVTRWSVGNVFLDFAGPGCAFTAEGSIDATYTNSTAQLSWPGDNTLTVTFVDAVDNCSDLIHEGATGAAIGDFVISPPQTITG